MGVAMEIAPNFVVQYCVFYDTLVTGRHCTPLSPEVPMFVRGTTIQSGNPTTLPHCLQ